jgi:phospholipase C
VPAILVSPYIEAGTVFRSTTTIPYDHTSILATLAYCLRIPRSAMLPSLRIGTAPTFDNVLTLSSARTDEPAIAPRSNNLSALQTLMSEPPNDVQKSIIVALQSNAWVGASRYGGTRSFCRSSRPEGS